MCLTDRNDLTAGLNDLFMFPLFEDLTDHPQLRSSVAAVQRED